MILKNKQELIEKLAELEHEQWKYFAKGILESERRISMVRRLRWKALFIPYAQLTNEQKEDDRKWAREVIKIFEKEGNYG